jgi:hypothetical protein
MAQQLREASLRQFLAIDNARRRGRIAARQLYEVTHFAD